MKKIFLVIAVAMLTISCEDYLDFLKENDNAPTLLIVKENGEELALLKDTLKLPSSIKDEREEFFRIKIKGFDPEGGLSTLTGKIINGNGTITQNGGQQLSFDSNGIADVIYTPNSNLLSTHILEFTATDNLGNIGTTKVELLVIVNLLPIASFKLTERGVADPYEFFLDATASFDQDANKGGQIVALEWSINGTIFTDRLNNENGIFDGLRITRFVFPGKGTYEIILVAIDNDGGRSAEVNVVRTIN